MSLFSANSTLPFFPTRQTIYIICSTIVLQVVVVVLCFRWFGSETAGNNLGGLQMATLTVFPATAGLAWIWLHAIWSEPRGWHGVGMSQPPTKLLIPAIFAGIFALVLNNLIGHLFQPILGAPSPLPIGGEGGLSEQSGLVIAAFFIGAVVLAPALEELIFRGILFARLRQKYTFLPAAAIAAVTHAAMHGDVATMPGLTVVFMIFAYLYEKYRCLWLPIIAHGVHNLLIAGAAILSAG